MSFRRFILVVAALGAMAAPPAHGVEVDHADWSEGDATASCTTGVNTRKCTYKVANTNCLEAAVSTGTGIWLTIPCVVRFTGTVTVQPRVNAAGRVIGCTSVVGTETGTIEFDSNVSDSFDRTGTNAIGVNTLTVTSTNPDQSNALVKFSGTASANGFVWVATGSLVATCASAGASSGRTTAGEVSVSGEEVQL